LPPGNLPSSTLPFLRSITPIHPEEIEEHFILFSHTNLKKINRLANIHSSFLQNILYYDHNNFEIRILTEPSHLSPPQSTTDTLKDLSKQDIENLWVQTAAFFKMAQTLELDFIDFSNFHYQTLPIPIPHFSLDFTGKNENPASPKHIIEIFRHHPHFKDLDETNTGDIYPPLNDGNTFDPDKVYLFQYNDFASTILNNYSLNEIKNRSHLKININVSHPAQEKMIMLQLYNRYASEEVKLTYIPAHSNPDQPNTQCDLPRALLSIFEENPGFDSNNPVPPDDYVSIIRILYDHMKKSFFHLWILIVDSLENTTDANFLKYFLDAEGFDTDTAAPSPRIILVCFNTPAQWLDFNLELNETPVNLAGNWLKLSSITNHSFDIPPKNGNSMNDFDFNLKDDPNEEGIEQKLTRWVAGTQIEEARKLILQSGELSKSIPIKLLAGEIYRWEKKYRKLGRLLHVIKKDIHRHPAYLDQFHYLQFICADKTSNTEKIEKHLRQITGHYFSHRAAVLHSDYYIYKGDFKRAEILITQAVEYFHLHDHESCAIEAQTQWAKLRREQQNIPEAEKMYQNLFIKCEIKKFHILSAHIAIDLGNLYMMQDHFMRAEVWYKKALLIYQKLKNTNGIILAKSNRAEINKIKGNWAEARKDILANLKYDKKENIIAPIAVDYFNLAHLEYLKHQFNRALEFLETSRKLFKEKNNTSALLECEFLKLKINLLSDSYPQFNWDFFNHHHSKLTGDQKKMVELIQHLLQTRENTPPHKLSRLLIEHISQIESKAARFEIITALIRVFPSNHLLELFKSVSMILSREEKNYFYYEYYYIYYDVFPGKIDSPSNNTGNDSQRFNDIYYFFLKNQRKLSPGIIRYKQELEEKEWKEGIFRDAQLVGHSIQWKIPEDFFKSLVNELRILFPDTSPDYPIKLVVYKTNSEKPIFEFFTGNRFGTLTDELVKYAFHHLEDLNLTPDKIGTYCKTSEKAFYDYKNTKAILWRMSETLFGVLLAAFSTDRYIHVDAAAQLKDWLKKYGTLIHHYYETDYKIHHQLNFIIGRSDAIKRLKEQIIKVGKVDFSLLIRGESGSGKELVAKATHLLSRKSDKPFVAVNAAAIPENLLEAELFGYKKGAFTGANENKVGLIEAADGGTLFLDEIADLPLNLQAKMLRVLQENEFRRLGENMTRSVNIRLISATNKDLKELIAHHRFREDLYFRIQDLTIDVPPLREREEDIPLLVRHFFKKYGFFLPGNDEFQDIVHYFSGRIWTGNVRELESCVKRLITYYPDFEIESTAMERKKYRRQTGGLIEARNNFESRLIRQTLEENKWNKTAAADSLHISRQYLFTLIQKHKIEAE